jgi:hypothetical protein
VSQHRSWTSRLAELVREFSFLPVMQLCPGTATFEADKKFWTDLLEQEAKDAFSIIVQGRKLLLGLAEFMTSLKPDVQNWLSNVFIALVDKSTSISVDFIELGITVATPASIKSEVARISKAEAPISVANSSSTGIMLGISISKPGAVSSAVELTWTRDFKGTMVALEHPHHRKAELVSIFVEEQDDISTTLTQSNIMSAVNKWRWSYNRIVILFVHHSKLPPDDFMVVKSHCFDLLS